MKKFLLFAASVMLTVGVSSQTKMRVWSGNSIAYEQSIAQIDSITFAADIVSSVNPFIEMINDSVVNLIMPPDDEIWYTSLTNDTLPFPRHGGTIISNTYVNGKGIFKFDAPVTNEVFNSTGGFRSEFKSDNLDEAFSYFTSMALPRTVTELNVYEVLADLCYCKYLIFPNTLSSIGTDFIGGYGKYRDDLVHVFFTSQVAPTHDWRTFWNTIVQDCTIYHYPIDGDYNSFIQSIDQEMATDPRWKYKWQPTTYTFK